MRTRTRGRFRRTHTPVHSGTVHGSSGGAPRSGHVTAFEPATDDGEDAYAVEYTGDAHPKSEKLSTWELKRCISELLFLGLLTWSDVLEDGNLLWEVRSLCPPIQPRGVS